jgi:hypothetical protein
MLGKEANKRIRESMGRVMVAILTRAEKTNIDHDVSVLVSLPGALADLV